MPSEPKTLLQIAGAALTPSSLTDSVPVIVDAQNEYRDGKLPLEGIAAASPPPRPASSSPVSARVPAKRKNVQSIRQLASPCYAGWLGS